MNVKQFEDKNLSHYSYAIVSKGEIALIDPARDPQPYYDFAKENNAKITAVIETHPHADFVSSHLEIHKTTGATVYVSRLLGAEYAHATFDDGDKIKLGEVVLSAMNTPGHSPDSISIVLHDKNGKQHAVFTGDTLFIGDCGRPDLRESAGAITAARQDLAKQMYHSLRSKLMKLDDDVVVYPAHGAGSLCGKGLGTAASSTIGEEKAGNWSLKEMSEDVFVENLLSDQPFIPKYFPFDVSVNKKGADNYQESVSAVMRREPITCQRCVNALDPEIVIIDARPQEQFKLSHHKSAINLMNDLRFETWLGSIVNPGERFYLVAESKDKLEELISRAAKIGYEKQIEEAFEFDYKGGSTMEQFDSSVLKQHADEYTIVDIRNHSEVISKPIFSNTIHIPLHELRERTNEIPSQKPIVVHCAGGYRSAAGSSIIKSKLNGNADVYDLSVAVKEFQQ